MVDEVAQSHADGAARQVGVTSLVQMVEGRVFDKHVHDHAVRNMWIHRYQPSITHGLSYYLLSVNLRRHSIIRSEKENYNGK